MTVGCVVVVVVVSFFVLYSFFFFFFVYKPCDLHGCVAQRIECVSRFFHVSQNTRIVEMRSVGRGVESREFSLW